MPPDAPNVSIVIPVYNGAALVEACHRALAPVLDSLPDESEVIYVDDGSHDGTLDALAALQRRDRRVRIVELVANFGQHAAFSAGFETARGIYLVTMDVDLQADPADIPRLVSALREGYELVSGVRRRRHDPLLRRLASRLVTRLVSRTGGMRLRDVGCPLNALTADVARNLSGFGELRRFLKPLAARVARRVTEVEVAHRPRPGRGERSSYSATALVRVFMDFLVPSLGDVFAWIFLGGAALAGLAALVALGGLIVFLLGRASLVLPVGGIVLAAVAAGVMLFGLAGDYLQRIYRQSMGRPLYLIRRVHEPGDRAQGTGGG